MNANTAHPIKGERCSVSEMKLFCNQIDTFLSFCIKQNNPVNWLQRKGVSRGRGLKTAKGFVYLKTQNSYRKWAFFVQCILFTCLIAFTCIRTTTNAMAMDATNEIQHSLSSSEQSNSALKVNLPIKHALSNMDEIITETKTGLPMELLAVPTSTSANTGFKAYMDYRTLTCTTSTQYAMQQEASTDPETGIRLFEGYYMVALGTYYASGTGERFLITLDSGVSFYAITGDIKSDNDTDAAHQHRNGCIVEFIVDKDMISQTCLLMGDMSYAGFSGKVVSIERIVETTALCRGFSTSIFFSVFA